MSDRDLDHLARELRRWARRPGSLSPRAARTRVVAGLPRRRRRPVWRLVTGGVALAATALALALVVDRPREPVPGPAPAIESDQRMIVHQLSSGIKLYVVVRPDFASEDR